MFEISENAEGGRNANARTETEQGVSPSTTFAHSDRGLRESTPTTPSTTQLDVRTLAYIMHPSHDTAALYSAKRNANGDLVSAVKSDAMLRSVDMVAQACALLGVPTQALEQ
jgi:hypothetical protein